MPFSEVILPVVLCVFGLLALVFSVWVFLTAPKIRHKRMEKYKAVRFAHRGLHGKDVPENTLAAFRRAVNAGFGIELDIRLSREGELVVFHDVSLKRAAGIDKKVIELSKEELNNTRIFGSSYTVPAFKDVLSLVGGKVPLLVEIKSGPGEYGVAERFLEEISGYTGDYIAESFNPKALRTVKRKRPDIPIGILSAEFSKDEKYRGNIAYKFLERLRFNFFARPDFIAYDHKGYKVLALRALRFIYRVPTVAWTVTSKEEEALARGRGFDTVIFENYIPE